MLLSRCACAMMLRHSIRQFRCFYARRLMLLLRCRLFAAATLPA